MKWCQLLTVILCTVTITSGQQSEFIKLSMNKVNDFPTVYLTLGFGSNITTNNTENIITDIGEDVDLPRLTCHTDSPSCCRSFLENNGNGGLGEWTFPNGSVVPNIAVDKVSTLSEMLLS